MASRLTRTVGRAAARQAIKSGGARLEGSITPTITRAVDYVVEKRADSARQIADRFEADHLDETADEIADRIIARYRRELLAVGGASGGVAAVAGVGTVAGVATASADIALAFTRLSEMILAIGHVYGFESDDVEERRAWVLVVLGYAAGRGTMVEVLAGQLGSQLTARAVRRVPLVALRAVNRQIVRRIIGRWGMRRGVISLGSLLPLGAGAAFGASANAVLVKRVGTQAKRFFS